MRLRAGKWTTDSTEAGAFRPQLTSLVDVMTILLVFLLKSFSVEGNLVTPSDDLELPLSTAQKPPKPTCTIEITRNAISSEGTIISPLAEVAAQDSLLVAPLHEWMLLQRERCEDTARMQEVMIQSDREIPFHVVKRVMYTCSKAGFKDFSVLVLEQE
jgi:biopolymer transport protein TolR